jgi:hypothetical protein
MIWLWELAFVPCILYATYYGTQRILDLAPANLRQKWGSLGRASVCRNCRNAQNEYSFPMMFPRQYCAVYSAQNRVVSFVIDMHSAMYSAHNRVMSFVIDLHSAVYSAHNLVMSFLIDLHSAVYSAPNRVMSFVIDLHSSVLRM